MLDARAKLLTDAAAVAGELMAGSGNRREGAIKLATIDAASGATTFDARFFFADDFKTIDPPDSARVKLDAPIEHIAQRLSRDSVRPFQEVEELFALKSEKLAGLEATSFYAKKEIYRAYKYGKHY